MTPKAETPRGQVVTESPNATGIACGKKRTNAVWEQPFRIKQDLPRPIVLKTRPERLKVTVWIMDFLTGKCERNVRS